MGFKHSSSYLGDSLKMEKAQDILMTSYERKMLKLKENTGPNYDVI